MGLAYGYALAEVARTQKSTTDLLFRNSPDF